MSKKKKKSCANCSHCSLFNDTKWICDMNPHDDLFDLYAEPPEEDVCEDWKNEKTEKEETVTLKKSTLLGILHLLALSAFSVSSEGNGIYRDIDWAEDSSSRGCLNKAAFESIKKRLENISKANRLVMDAIPADDISVSECVDEVIRKAKFRKLLEWYGADLEDNFRKI